MVRRVQDGLEGFSFSLMLLTSSLKKALNYFGSTFYKRLFNHQKLKKQLKFIGDGLFGDGSGISLRLGRGFLTTGAFENYVKVFFTERSKFIR